MGCLIKLLYRNYPKSIFTSRQISRATMGYFYTKHCAKPWQNPHISRAILFAKSLRAPKCDSTIPNTSDWVCTHPLLYLPNGWWFLIVRSSTADRITADTCFVLLMRTACNRPLQRIIVHTSTCLCQKKTAHTATHHHCHALSTRDACPCSRQK